MKREFNLSYKQDIIDGKVKVVTDCGEPVEIVKWDCKSSHPILAVIDAGDTSDSCFYDEEGLSPSKKDRIYVLTDEPESEDERIRKFLKLIIGEWSYDDLSAKGFKKENIIAWLEKQGEQKPKRMVSAEAKEAMYDRPAWSEEDQETIDYLIDYLEDKLDCSYTDLDKETFTKEITLLKSIRPQNTWKPSDEQMEALKFVIKSLDNMFAAIGYMDNYTKPRLEEILEALKKLREE